MKTGMNLLLWTSHVTAEHFPILKDLKKAGYDTVEIPMFEGDPQHYRMLEKNSTASVLAAASSVSLALRARIRSRRCCRSRCRARLHQMGHRLFCRSGCRNHRRSHAL